jgi:exoribonuclease R
MANEHAGREIVRRYPKLALLRKHPPPTVLKKLSEIAKLYDVHTTFDSSKEIQGFLESVRKISRGSYSFGELIGYLFVLQMRRAEYVCINGTLPESWRHFNLNLDIYTHFTSPIRRYADLIVHRLLSDTGVDMLTSESVASIAANCNDRHLRSFERDLSVLYFSHMIKGKDLKQRAVIVELNKQSFRLLVPETGIEGFFRCDQLKSDSKLSMCLIKGDDVKNRFMELTWEDRSLTYELFDEIDVILRFQDGVRAGIDMKVLPPE